MKTLVVLLVALACASCVAVKPYQREHLAMPGMDLSATTDQHVYESREGSSGAYGAVGGGCGCN